MIELRKQLRQLRKSIDKKTRKEDGKKILQQCQKNGLFENAKHIAIFIPNDGEIETKDTIKFLKNTGCFVYLPILVEEKLKFAEMGEHFRKNRFGIDEPIHTPIMGAKQMDLIFMPLVGFDKNKNRLGTGGISQFNYYLFSTHCIITKLHASDISNETIWLEIVCLTRVDDE